MNREDEDRVALARQSMIRRRKTATEIEPLDEAEEPVGRPDGILQDRVSTEEDEDE